MTTKKYLGQGGPGHEATTTVRQAIDKLFRRNWRLRRLLDFTRPYRMQDRALQRAMSRARRQRVASRLREIAGSDAYDEGVFGPRAMQFTFADLLAPPRGRPRTFPKNFCNQVNALVLASQAGVRTHRIMDENDRRPIGWGDQTKAIRAILTMQYGRTPTKCEVAVAQAICRRQKLRARIS